LKIGNTQGGGVQNPLKEFIALLFLFLSLTMVAPSIASDQIVTVAMEPFPPLINEDGSGYTINMLKKIEGMNDLKFSITIMSYARAKMLLETNKVDLIAHTPFKLEEPDFYDYAQELTWKIDVISDLYAISEEKLKDIANLEIGIPRGNEDFAAGVLCIPKEHFYVGEIENLLKMLQVGRIDVFWFERVSTMTTLKRLGIANVYYKRIPNYPVPVGIAVAKNSKGTILRHALEQALAASNWQENFKNYLQFNQYGAKGLIK